MINTKMYKELRNRGEEAGRQRYKKRIGMNDEKQATAAVPAFRIKERILMEHSNDMLTMQCYKEGRNRNANF